MHARKRKGFGWARWSRQWLYDTLKLFNGNRVVGQSRKSPQKGPVPLEAKQTDERSASSRHVERSWERGMVEMLGHLATKGEATGNTNFDPNRRASSRAYL